MDMVRVDGMGGGVKMVISQQQNRVDCDGSLTTTVEVVSMVDCTDMNHGADPRVRMHSRNFHGCR